MTLFVYVVHVCVDAGARALANAINKHPKLSQLYLQNNPGIAKSVCCIELKHLLS